MIFRENTDKPGQTETGETATNVLRSTSIRREVFISNFNSPLLLLLRKSTRDTSTLGIAGGKLVQAAHATGNAAPRQRT